MRLPTILMTLAWTGLAACGSDPAAPPANSQPAAMPDPKIVGLPELEALVKQARGQGALVNLWATW